MKIVKTLIVAWSLLLSHGLLAETDVDSLGQDIADAKLQLLDIDQQIYRLEQALIHPADQQVAVFVSLDPNSSIIPQQVTIRTPNTSAVEHEYSVEEISALQQGAIQPLAELNLANGIYPVTAEIVSATGKEYEALLEINKTAGSLFVELVIDGSESSLHVW